MTQSEFIQAAYQIQKKQLDLNLLMDLAQLTEKEKNMAVSQPVADLITKFDAATDAIAARIQRLIDSSGTLSDDDKTALQGEVDKLNKLGQDPENPVPTV